MVRNTRHGTNRTAPVTAEYVTGEDGVDDCSSSVAPDPSRRHLTREKGVTRFGTSTDGETVQSQRPGLATKRAQVHLPRWQVFESDG